MKAILMPFGDMPRIIDVEGLRDLQSAASGLIEPCSWIFDDESAGAPRAEGFPAFLHRGFAPSREG